MRTGSLFTGGGGLDLGFERAGFDVKWQVENNKHCNTILAKHWPDVERYEDVRTLPVEELPEIAVLIGGDPCPARSRITRSGGPSVHPDLSGFFLSIAGRARPRWVVRENVLAPDAIDFAFGLALLGYGVASVELDSRDFTSQSRGRQFIVGGPERGTAKLAEIFERASDQGHDQAMSSKGQVFAPCLTTHPSRYSKDDCFIFDARRRNLRTLSIGESEALQGFPPGWTDGIPFTAQWRLIGNAVTVPVAQWVAERVLEADQV